MFSWSAVMKTVNTASGFMVHRYFSSCCLFQAFSKNTLDRELVILYLSSSDLSSSTRCPQSHHNTHCLPALLAHLHINGDRLAPISRPCSCREDRPR